MQGSEGKLENSSSPPNPELQAKFHALLGKLSGLAVSQNFAPKDSLIVLDKDSGTVVGRAEFLRSMATASPENAGPFKEILQSIAASSDDDGAHYPVLWAHGGRVAITFVPCHLLTAGGAA